MTDEDSGSQSRGATLAIIGSSNAAGMGASTYSADPSEETGWRSPATSWAGLLSQHFRTVAILNFSVSGANSDWAVRRLSLVEQHCTPTHVFMCTNPIADEGGTETYLRNCRIFIDACRPKGIVPIVRGGYAYNGYDDEAYRSILRLNRDLAGLDCRYVDNMADVADGAGHYRYGQRYHVDGLHPNDAGYRLFYDSMIKDNNLGLLTSYGDVEPPRPDGGFL